ncbi:hypothetical protein [Arenimonas sp.]|uniref:hypothetical protein n=1 Tax=Arenimonas sp. TaxID=1872635 RepID=UPI0039E24C6B
MNDSSIAPRAAREGWPLPLPLEAMLSALKSAAHYLLQAGLTPASLLHLGGAAFEKLGFRSLASGAYERAIRSADRSSSRGTFLVRQGWQFIAERNRFRQGRPRVQDPLFHVSAMPDPTSRTDTPRHAAAGYYEVHVTHRGLRIDGFLRPGVKGRQIDVLVDGRSIRQTSASRVVRGLYLLVVHIQRDALAALPSSARLSLHLSDGGALLFRGCEETLLDIPHGQNAAGVGDLNVKLDKKGFLLKDKPGVAELQRGFLQIYQAASRFFEAELGTPLFVLYGTLLGQHRGGDFIPGDDDFDVGYWSDAATSKEVRSEGMAFVVKLVRAGFVVTLNREGRLFRLRLPGMAPACHLDVHAVWRERESLWIHPRANLDCARTDFLPAGKARMRDVEVTVPAKPEAFLSAYYGADWRVPNPAYSTASRPFPGWKVRLLRRSCVTPALVGEMQSRIAPPPAAGTGMLIANGSQSIYPLERYEELCDW